MAVNRQKLKLLYLMRMLEEETDSEQGLTMAQILEKLEEQGISAERKSIYRDIEALREFGVDVRTYQRAPVEYAVEHRDFAFPELLLLVDAVQSSRFLTQRKSDALVEGVKRLASKRQRVDYKRSGGIAGLAPVRIRYALRFFYRTFCFGHRFKDSLILEN